MNVIPFQKVKEISSPKHEDWLRTLDCFVCGKPSQSMLAHIRIGWFTMSRKPGSDKCVPLCGECHQNSPYAQHRHNERAWWNSFGYPNPLAGAAHLFAHSGNYDALNEARQIAAA